MTIDLKHAFQPGNDMAPVVYNFANIFKMCAMFTICHYSMLFHSVSSICTLTLSAFLSTPFFYFSAFTQTDNVEKE